MAKITPPAFQAALKTTWTNHHPDSKGRTVCEGLGKHLEKLNSGATALIYNKATNHLWEVKRLPDPKAAPGGACECIEYCEPDFDCCLLWC
jgi:hypothetical protein